MKGKILNFKREGCERGDLEIYRSAFKRMHYPSLAEFKSSVCVTLKEGSKSSMSLPLVIEQIFNAQPGRAFPEEMGKTTKIELTTEQITNMFPKLAAHAGTTFLGSIIAVTLMILKGVGASKK